VKGEHERNWEYVRHAEEEVIGDDFLKSEGLERKHPIFKTDLLILQKKDYSLKIDLRILR